MVPIDMSLDARMMLTRMSLIYEREQGRRVRMSRDEDIVAIINFALQTLNNEYRRYYDAFVGLLTANEVRTLVAQGAQIYRGAVVAEQAAESPMAVEAPRTYRGVVQEAPARPGEDAAKPARPQRVYRGRVVED